MKEIVRYRFRGPNAKTSPEHLTLEEAAVQYPGWEPWAFTKRVERIREPCDPEGQLIPSGARYAARTKDRDR